MGINYTNLATTAFNLIKNTFGGIPCTVRFLDNSTVSTTIVFDQGTTKNIDNRQNPTTIVGLVGQIAYIPAIAYVPDVGGQVEFYTKVGGSMVFNVKTISQVDAVQPTTIPIYYQLMLE
jgi:hypothetical protein